MHFCWLSHPSSQTISCLNTSCSQHGRALVVQAFAPGPVVQAATPPQLAQERVPVGFRWSCRTRFFRPNQRVPARQQRRRISRSSRSWLRSGRIECGRRGRWSKVPCRKGSTQLGFPGASFAAASRLPKLTPPFCNLSRPSKGWSHKRKQVRTAQDEPTMTKRMRHRLVDDRDSSMHAMRRVSDSPLSLDASPYRPTGRC